MSSGHSRQLAFLNDVIEEDFYFDAAIGAVALRTNKGRRPDAGVRAICAVLSILSGLAIQTVCAVTNILRLAFLNDAVDAYIDFYAAIGAVPLSTFKRSGMYRGRIIFAFSTACTPSACQDCDE